MSICMDRDNYGFLRGLTKEERSGIFRAVRDLVSRGRTPLAVKRYIGWRGPQRA
ncbi:MAG TPA: hypothetical protein VNF74_05095 [Terriglobales bacterium]|nr:hypothetical protein [Terriglobales bacterium]